MGSKHRHSKHSKKSKRKAESENIEQESADDQLLHQDEQQNPDQFDEKQTEEVDEQQIIEAVEEPTEEIEEPAEEIDEPAEEIDEAQPDQMDEQQSAEVNEEQAEHTIERVEFSQNQTRKFDKKRHQQQVFSRVRVDPSRNYRQPDERESWGPNVKGKKFRKEKGKKKRCPNAGVRIDGSVKSVRLDM